MLGKNKKNKQEEKFVGFSSNVLHSQIRTWRNISIVSFIFGISVYSALLNSETNLGVVDRLLMSPLWLLNAMLVYMCIIGLVIIMAIRSIVKDMKKETIIDVTCPLISENDIQKFREENKDYFIESKSKLPQDSLIRLFIIRVICKVPRDRDYLFSRLIKFNCREGLDAFIEYAKSIDSASQLEHINMHFTVKDNKSYALSYIG